MYKKLKYRKKILENLLPFADGVKRYCFFSFLAGFAMLFLNLATPVFYELFITRVILQSEFSQMIVVVAGYMTVCILKFIVGYLRVYSDFHYTRQILYLVRFKIWSGFLNLPFPMYETAEIGDMKLRLDDDTEKLRGFFGSQVIDYFISCGTVLVTTFLLVRISWYLSVIVIAAIPVTFAIDHAISKREKVLTNENRDIQQRTTTWLRISSEGWREVKALTLEHSQERKFVGLLHEFALYFSKWINYWVLRALIVPKIKDEFLMKFVLYFIGGLMILDGKIKIGDLLVFSMYYEMLSKAANAVSTADADLQANMPYTDRILDSIKKPQEKNKEYKALDQSDRIEFQNVCFRYSEDRKNVIHNMSFTLEKGERVAIVGKSGSGKTTILKLMTGMLIPQSGKILFSGVDLSEINIKELHKRIGFVMQENTLFNTTIRENLLYGKEDASDNELWEACRKACIDEFVSELPLKLDTVVGEKGIRLSGGQRQRLVLARLFLRNVNVYILDEATSALDQYSENIVQDALKNISEDKTIIVVSHRTSSIQFCSKRIELVS